MYLDSVGKHRIFSDGDKLTLERFWSITHPHHRRKPERYTHRYRKDAPKLRALVVVHCGIIQELCHIGEALEWLIDESGEDMTRYLEGDGVDLPNGVYIWEGEVKDSGCYDSYYGVHESDPYLEGGYRPATKEEWEYHVNGDYPWDPALWFDSVSQDPEPPSKEEDQELRLFNPNLKI